MSCIPKWLYQAAFALVVVGVSFVGGQSAQALESGDKLFVSGDNTFFIYAQGGEKISASFKRSSQKEPGNQLPHDVSLSLEGPGLATQKCVLPKAVAVDQGCGFDDVLAPKTGIYRVVFKLPEAAQPYTEVSPTVRWGANLFSWTIAVADESGEKPGRIWTEIYAIRQPAQSEYADDLTFHYVSESGYVYTATRKGFNGQISILSADAFGIRIGKDCQSAYQSIDTNDQRMSPSFGTCGGSYKQFFERPAGNLPQSALRWDDKNEWLVPPIKRPTVSDLQFISDKKDDVQSGAIKFTLKNFVGQYFVRIDTNGDGSYDGTEDIKIPRTIKKLDEAVQQIRFDGINRGGQQIPATQPIGIKVQIQNVAEIHIVDADVEGRTGGLELIRQNGENAPTTRMCWDDTKLAPITLGAAFTTALADGRACPDSSKGVHGWGYAKDSWGDLRYIDDWTYAQARVDGTAEIRYPDDPGVLGVKKASANMMLVGAVVVGAVVVITLVLGGTMIARRRRRLQQLRQAQVHQQSSDYPYSSGPQPPLSR